MSFKPYYKWITFNTLNYWFDVLKKYEWSFKPYYKWITFNTEKVIVSIMIIRAVVLNLIINGLPSIHEFLKMADAEIYPIVLNLIINGLPSILLEMVCKFKNDGVLNLIINGLPSIHCRNVLLCRFSVHI